jgi:hypothetical protein
MDWSYTSMEILKAIALPIAGAVGYGLAAIVLKLLKLLELKIKIAQDERATSIVRENVHSAEQQFEPEQNAQKKEFVVAVSTEQLAVEKIKLTPGVLDNKIESIVQTDKPQLEKE